jgi:poly(glycerol-phosphate) alpha-glucosyltransferase
MLEPWAVRRSAWKKSIAAALFERAHLGGAACLHALNEAEARAIRAFGLRNPICVIPNGVELPATEISSAPDWAGWTNGRKVALFLGRIHPKKGLANLICAWRRVMCSIAPTDWALVIAGWDQKGHQKKLQELVRELELDGSVYFVGPHFGEAKAASLAHAEVFVLPSLSEGLPMAVLEAWSYGRPVVMTPQCNLPEGFQAGAALRIEPDQAGVEAGLRNLCAMPETELRRMGQRGRDLVAERFAWPHIAREMTQLYQWVLGRGAPPAGVVTGYET